jgi:hypothetical protein
VVRNVIQSVLVSADGVVGDPQLWAKTPLKLIGAKTLGTGVVTLSYQPVPA